MKKITFLGVLMLLSLINPLIKAEINFDLTTVSGGILTLDYAAVNTEKAKAQTDRWISVTNFASSGTASKCGSASATFDIKSGRVIDFYLAKCDQMTITANLTVGRGLSVSINGGAATILAGTGACKDYVVPVNSEIPVKISVQGSTTSSAWTSFFQFAYAAKVPTISIFKINGTSATIDQTAKTITLQMPFGTDITAITPEVTLGGTATSYSPAGVQNFTTGPVTYTITDGTTPVNYTVNITAKSTPDTDKSITTMSINGKTATINEATGAISCEFPSFTGALGSWPVVFTLSGATCSANVTSGLIYDFLTNNTLNITVTAQDNSTKVYTVAPVISTKKNIGMLTLAGAPEANDALFLSSFSDYYITYLTAAATAPTDITAFYANYDLIVLHANVSGTNATAIATKAMVSVKPILNMKAFFYNTGRWVWSTAAPQNAAVGVATADVIVNLQSHPIFNNVTFSGSTLTYFDNLPVTNTNAIQYASDLATIGSFTSQTIATVNTTGIQLHEIQDNLAAKFLMVGLGMENSNYSYLNSNSINILKNSAAYLLNPSAKYNYTTTNLNNLSEKNSVYYSKGVIFNPDQESIVIYNAAGIKVKASTQKTIDTQLMSRGVYLVQTDKNEVLKFIK